MLSILFKRKIAILTIFLTTVITVTVGSFLWPPTYEAKSSILVKFGRENIYRSEVGGDRIPQITSTQEEFLNSEINILTSRDNMERVIKALKVENFYSDWMLWIKNLFSKITPFGCSHFQF